MLEKSHKNDQKYVSCIKINGVPILPPVITSAKRKELSKCKRQAVKLEKRLKRERELREYISRYYLPKLEEGNIISESLEHKLSFLDDDTLKTPIEEHPHKSQSKLSRDLQVSQYTNNEFEVITNFENPTSQIETVMKDFPVLATEDVVTDNISEDLETGKPRLIRSNSYTLETPSPMLLQHLKMHTNVDIDSHLTNVPTKEIITSTPNDEAQDKLNVTKSDFLSETESELKNISDNSTQDDITILSKDILNTSDNDVNEIDNMEGDCDDNHPERDDLCSSLSSIKDLPLDPNDQEKLANILNAIPESYSKQILELLEKQKQEQMIRLNSYIKIKETYLTVGNVPIIMEPPLSNQNLTERSTYYTPESYVASPEEHENLNGFSYNVEVTSDDNKINSIPPKITQECEQFAVIHAPKSCMRRLFVYSESNDKETGKQNRAAAVIQAHIRGYLTRRLLRTERVQGLIQTIKDALICAMELHSENADNINESDVELHRRLIQQVSAAVYTFYDVFFMTTVPEQMAVIRIDRDRLKEKLKRPHSKGSSISSRSSRNSRFS